MECNLKFECTTVMSNVKKDDIQALLIKLCTPIPSLASQDEPALATDDTVVPEWLRVNLFPTLPVGATIRDACDSKEFGEACKILSSMPPVEPVRVPPAAQGQRIAHAVKLIILAGMM